MQRFVAPQHGTINGSLFCIEMVPQVRIFRAGTVFCQWDRCHAPATHLFRTDKGPVVVYCERHAKAEARRLGIELPTCETDP